MTATRPPAEQDAITLAGGVRMPMLGLGTWRATGEQVYRAVRHALDLGYRHVDTASIYGNEDEVGQAVRDSGVPREQVFVTTKLAPGRVGQERRAIVDSLRALGLEYLDLCLVHWPPGGQARPATWKALLAARERQHIRAAGVSNYTIAQLDELIVATGQAPAVNQIAWSPSRYDPRTLTESRERGVAVQGYTPLRGTDLTDPVLVEIAAAHQATAAQVVLRWHLEHGVVAIPRSVRRDRLAENLGALSLRLTAAQVARIDGGAGLSRGSPVPPG